VILRATIELISQTQRRLFLLKSSRTIWLPVCTPERTWKISSNKVKFVRLLEGMSFFILPWSLSNGREELGE
jgi:hypothetical protein